MNKKYGIVVITSAIVVGVFALIFINYTNPTGQKLLNVTNSVSPSQQYNTTNSVIPKPSVTSGKHYFASINETMIVKSNP